MMTNIPNMHQLLSFFGPPIQRIVPTDSLTQIEQIAAKLPPLPGAILEYHFGKDKPRVDFSVRATSNFFGRNLLAKTYVNGNKKELFQENSHWQSMGSLIDKWANKETLIHKTIENIWLEFDIDRKVTALPTPSLFFDIDRNNRLPLASKLTVVKNALSYLKAVPSLDCCTQIHRCLNLVPKTAQLYYIGKMFSRKTEALRLSILGMKPNEIPTYLSQIQWGGDIYKINRLIMEYAQHADAIILDLDVGTTLQNKIGIEFKFADRKPVLWNDFFSLLVKNGGCTAAEATKLLNWTGKSFFPKGTLQEQLSKLMNHEVKYLIRRINHVKFGIDANGELTIKVYLYFCYY